MQTVLVIVVVSGALVYLGQRAWKLWSGKKQKGCEKCGVQELKKP